MILICKNNNYTGEYGDFNVFHKNFKINKKYYCIPWHDFIEGYVAQDCINYKEDEALWYITDEDGLDDFLKYFDTQKEIRKIKLQKIENGNSLEK